MNDNHFQQQLAQYTQAAQNYTVERNEQPQPEPTPEPETHQEQPQEQPQEASSSAPAAETPKEYNMRMLRKRAEEEEKKRKELERRLQQLEEERNSYQAPQPRHTAPQQPEEELSYNDDDIPTWGELKRYNQKIEKTLKQQREEMEQRAREQAMMSAESKFRAEHPDAERVLSKENIDAFKRIYPYEYQSVTSNPDTYAQLKAAYSMITRFGVMEDEEIENRVAKNTQQPKPGSSAQGQVGTSPLAQVNDYGRRVMTEDRAKQIRENMKRARGLHL